MAEGRGRVGKQVTQQVGQHFDRATRNALATPKDSVDQLENVAVEAWHNLVGPDGFLPVLILIFLAMISSPLIGNSELGTVVTVLIGASALLLSVFRSTHRERVRRMALIYVSVATVATIGAYVAHGANTIDNDRLAVIVMSLNLVVLVTTLPLILIRSFQHRRITVNTVCATLSAYLLIGLIFTTIYRLSGQVSPPFFTQFEGGGTPTAGEYSYFSFITLTTVGFGDFTASSDPGRAFVMVEAVLGQIFLVTMLARVVAMLGVQRDVPDLFGADDGTSAGPDTPTYTAVQPDDPDDPDRTHDTDDTAAERS